MGAIKAGKPKRDQQRAWMVRAKGRRPRRRAWAENATQIIFKIGRAKKTREIETIPYSETFSLSLNKKHVSE
jgi:hypothetical protein